MKKILSVRQPFVATYTSYGTIFSILPENALSWIMNNFIQIHYVYDWDMVTFDGHKLLMSNCPSIDYFNEEGNRWSLGCMTFKSTDDFNYQYLKEYINKNKINIKELSASIDVSENAVRNWINGKSRPYVWNAIAICICLDIDERKIIIKK